MAFGVVGFGAVLVEQEQSHLGGVAQFFGSDPGGRGDEVGFELVAVGGAYEGRHGGEGVAQHGDVVGGDQSGALGGGHDREQGR